MSFTAIILAAAKTVGVPGALLLAICTNESGLQNVHTPYDSGSSSYGICQVKEGTAKLVGMKIAGGSLLVPEINAEAAARYLKLQLERYDGDWIKATSAYNLGVYRESHIHPGYPINRTYIKRVRQYLAENQYRLDTP